MAKPEEIPALSENARKRLYQLVGYSQGSPADRQDAEIELAEHGLFNLSTNQETAKGHRVAEYFLFY